MVFLRWLLIDMAISRLLRNHRNRRYAGGPTVVSAAGRSGLSILAPAILLRRTLLSCLGGCLGMMLLGILLIALLVGWR